MKGKRLPNGLFSSDLLPEKSTKEITLVKKLKPNGLFVGTMFFSSPEWISTTAIEVAETPVTNIGTRL